MADITLEVGAPQISFATHASLSPAAANVMEIGTPTEIEFSLLNLADTAAVQSAKFTLPAQRAPRYSVRACLEWQVAAPTTALTVEFYIGWSESSSALVGNSGFLTGSDGAYTGTPATLVEGLSQLQFIGVQVATADIEFQISTIGTFVPLARYGSLVVRNLAGQTLCDTDIVETNVVFNPLVGDVA